VRRDCVARRLDRIAEIPAARPPRALPYRKVTWLVLLSGRHVLLERRPAPGIWGGLWSFPEAPLRAVDAFCSRVLGCEVIWKKRLAPLEHGFTHFRLKIEPLLCKVKRKPVLEAPGRRWTALSNAHGEAVPAPVRALLKERLGTA
jgi:A/G-specific adenine glycosylase